jgi:hypothetical protein
MMLATPSLNPWPARPGNRGQKSTPVLAQEQPGARAGVA